MSSTKTLPPETSALRGGTADAAAIQSAHEALRTSERHLRSVFDGAIDGMIVVDERRRLVDVNPAFCILFGRSKADLLGTSIDTLSVTGAASAELLWQRFQRRGKTQGNVRVTRPDGSERCVEYTATANIVPGRHLGVIRDTTERVHAEAACRRLAAIVESSDDAIIASSVDDTIQTWNRGAMLLYGFDSDEAVGRSLEIIVPWERRAELGLLRERVERGEHVEHFETVRLRKDGVRVPVSLSVAPIKSPAGTVTGISSIARDMTERKRFEVALREKNLELQRANLAKDRFLAGMSHELRTPLNAVIGFAGTLLMRLPGPLTGEQERQLRTIQGSARHLLSLINELLDVAKIESGAVQLRPESISCQEIIGEVLDSLRPTADAKKLLLESDLSGKPIVLCTDRRALRQILLNLVGNGLKFSERGGVRVTLKEISSGHEDSVLFRVSDTGPGIKREDLTQLFQPFRRFSGGSESEGTGLGLYLSRNLAHVLGGDIVVSSAVGRGSVFTLQMRVGR